jgi:hypothetical protein
LSLFKKIQEHIIPIQTSNATPLFQPNQQIKHEFVKFSNAYRIGIICYLTDYESQQIIEDYRKQLEKLGYDCEVLIYIDKPEKMHHIYLQSFGSDDLDKKTLLPHSPRTDRFIVKRYDILLNLYLNNCPQLLFMSYMSYAKCRVAPYLEHFKHCSDVLIPVDHLETIESFIIKINKTLQIQPHERKQI